MEKNFNLNNGIFSIFNVDFLFFPFNPSQSIFFFRWKVDRAGSGTPTVGVRSAEGLRPEAFSSPLRFKARGGNKGGQKL